jgi:hypothetical protein
MLGEMAKEVMFLIHLRRNILKMDLGIIIDTHYSVRLHWCLETVTLGVSYIREHICRVLLPECH